MTKTKPVITLFKNNSLVLIATGLMGLTLMTGCDGPKQKETQKDTQKKVDTTAKVPVHSANQTSLTLPALDALFYEKDFTAVLKSKLGLTTEQIAKLKAAAHTSVADLSEDGIADTVSTRSAVQRYNQQIVAIIGDDKAQQLQQLVSERYSQGLDGLAPTKPNFVPTDTRIVVNAPAFRMDVFQNGHLLKSYKVGIGYPEFPLPTGMRRADTLIFNPSWTPPDEPWVKGKFQPGKKVSGSNEDNPLGVIKIPIGMPSLIHGGKPLTKIGNFASHGCVGLTNSQVQDFTATVAQLGGSNVTAESVKAFKSKGKTQSIKLPTPVPVDLRYETIVAQNGSLHIYRDVYERGTNTIETAKQILDAYNVNYDKLTQQEKTELDTALDEMNRDARGNSIATDNLAPSKDGVPASKQQRSKQGKITSRVKGQKEAVVAIAALQGKGYPEPVDLNTGVPAKN
ncbi:L,D-transpeptidase [Mucilaginibacter sp.]|uniref:L,D-transpeptidase n=1 Tax=Mucilaginibacter sp. TaxID=1882438 RepID=UPI0035BC57B6